MPSGMRRLPRPAETARVAIRPDFLPARMSEKTTGKDNNNNTEFEARDRARVR